MALGGWARCGVGVLRDGPDQTVRAGASRRVPRRRAQGGTVSVLSPDNKPTEIAGSSQIFLDLPGGTYGGTFKSIQVSDGVFRGVMDNGQPIQVPLGSIQAARVTEPNRPAEGLGYLLLGSAIAVLAVTGVFAYALDTSGLRRQPLRGARPSRRSPSRDGACDRRQWVGNRPSGGGALVVGAVRGALARLWAESARGEHASVPAFSRLSLSLVALGAPAGLVEAALRAALDEIQHARLAFSLASTYAGEPVGPGPLPELQTAPAVTSTSLAELAPSP